MKIECLFIVRDGNNGPSGPELLTAWDEYTISENYEGWQEAIAAALKSVEGDYLSHRIVSVDVPDEELEKALEQPQVQARVIS